MAASSGPRHAARTALPGAADPRRPPLSPGLAGAGPEDTGGSVAEGEAVLARFGAADQGAALPVDPDRLAPADRHLAYVDVVAAAREIVDDRLGQRAFDLQLAAEGED